MIFIILVASRDLIFTDGSSPRAPAPKVVPNFFKSLSAVFEEWQDEDEDEAKEKTARENAGAGPDSVGRFLSTRTLDEVEAYSYETS